MVIMKSAGTQRLPWGACFEYHNDGDMRGAKFFSLIRRLKFRTPSIINTGARPAGALYATSFSSSPIF